MNSLVVFFMIILACYLVGCIRGHVIISVKKYMNIYIKVFFLKLQVATSNKPPPPDEELDIPPKEKEKKEKPEKKEKKSKKAKKGEAEPEIQSLKKAKAKVKKPKKTRKKRKKERLIKRIFKFILKILLKILIILKYIFVTIGKFLWRIIYGRLHFLHGKLQILRFNLFKKHVKEPKKPNPVTMHIDIMKMLEMLRDVLAAIFVKLWRYFRVRVKRFHITVATDDAAKTAMMYGAVCGFGDEIFAILEKALDFGVEKGALVGAECDYLSEEMKMDIEIDISITVGNVFRYLFGIVGAALAGVLHGIHIKVNKEFFSHNKKYKKDVVEYNKHKTLLKAYEEAQAAKKEARKKKAAEKAAKKAEKKRLKAAKKAEAQEASAAENNENKNEYLKTETSERDNTNVSE